MSTSGTAIESLSVKELKAELISRGESVTGLRLKKDYISRLSSVMVRR